MKVRSRISPFLCLLISILISGLSVISAVATALPAQADSSGVSFAFDYNPDPSKVTAMVKAGNDKGSDQSAWQDSEVYAQGGSVFGSGAEFTFQRVSDGGGATGGENQYAFDYTCAGGSPQSGAAQPNVDSYTIEVSIFSYISGPFNTQPNLSVDHAYVTHVTFNGAQNPNQTIQSYPDAHNAHGIPENDSNLKAMHFPSSCVAPPFSFGDRRSSAEGEKMPNLEAASQSVKDAWAPVVQAAQSSPGGNGPPGGSGPGGASPLDQCAANAGTFGWLLCPAIDVINNTFVKLFQNVVINNLKVTPLDTSGGGDANNQALYGTWNNIRTLANALFVLVFLVIIFANTLQFSLEAYAIKKVIPKLVAAAIFVQFSFILAALAIDLGNVLGEGINGLIQSVTPGAGGHVSDVLIAAGGVIAGAVALGAVAAVGIVAVITLAISALFAFIAIFFTLIVRKIIIDALIILAPLAFVAFVLPGTERFFKIWYQNFIRVILMYPIIALLFGISSLLSASSSGTGFQQVIAATFPIIACFLVPMTFKMAGGLMSFSGNFVNSRINKVGGKAKDSFKNGGLAKNLNNRQNSLRESGLQRLDARLGGLRGSTSRTKRALGAVGFRAGATALGRPFAGDLSRQRATSGLINQYDKELQDLSQATVPNLQDALTAKFGRTDTERKAAEARLRARGGGALLSYKDSHEGRQAMMRRLADKDATGAKLARLIRDPGSLATDRDRAALGQENGKNVPTNLGLFGNFDPADSTARGHSQIRGLTAKNIKEKLTTDNFDAVTDHATGAAVDPQADQFAQSFAGNMSQSELIKSFDTTGPGTAGADKRLAILRMMAHSSHFKAGGAGYGLRQALVHSIQSSGANQTGNSDAVGKLTAQEKAELKL